MDLFSQIAWSTVPMVTRWIDTGVKRVFANQAPNRVRPCCAGWLVRMAGPRMRPPGVTSAHAPLLQHPLPVNPWGVWWLVSMAGPRMTPLDVTFAPVRLRQVHHQVSKITTMADKVIDKPTDWLVALTWGYWKTFLNVWCLPISCHEVH